jgi:hypothetical protein
VRYGSTGLVTGLAGLGATEGCLGARRVRFTLASSGVENRPRSSRYGFVIYRLLLLVFLTAGVLVVVLDLDRI